MPNNYEEIEEFAFVRLCYHTGQGVNFDNGEISSAEILWEEIPKLITALRRAYNARPGQPETQSQADGVVASVLLQNAVANAPGDFS